MTHEPDHFREVRVAWEVGVKMKPSVKRANVGGSHKDGG